MSHLNNEQVFLLLIIPYRWRAFTIKKKIIWSVVSVLSIIVVWNLYTIFYGTSGDRALAINYATEYVSEKYNLPIESLRTDEPTYKFSHGTYMTKVRNTKAQESYLINVKITSNGDMQRIEEYSKNPVRE